MRRLSLAIMLTTLGLRGIAVAEWYAIKGNGRTTTFRVTDGDRIARVPAHKIDLRVTGIALRRDTENAERYWVEATLAEPRDSGDGYLLAYGDVVQSEIYTRGKKWAIRFASRALARRCFEYLREFHKLGPEHARDATKD